MVAIALVHGPEDVVPQWLGNTIQHLVFTVVVQRVVDPECFEEILRRRVHVYGVVHHQVHGVPHNKACQVSKGVFLDDQLEEEKQRSGNDHRQNGRHSQPTLIFRVIVVKPVHIIGRLFILFAGAVGRVVDPAVHDVLHEGEGKGTGQEETDDGPKANIRFSGRVPKKAGRVGEEDDDGCGYVCLTKPVEQLILKHGRRLTVRFEFPSIVFHMARI